MEAVAEHKLPFGCHLSSQADIVDDDDDYCQVQKSPIMAAADAVGEDLAIHASCNRPARPLP